jgi:hypothetical protein
MANFREFSTSIGARKKQITKHARAARLHAPKMSRRSHLLTADDQGQSVLFKKGGPYRNEVAA